VALAAAHLGRTAFLSKTRTLVRSDEPGVRSAAVEAMGALGGTSTLTTLRPLLADPSPEVRAAAVSALRKLATRVDRETVARSWVAGLATDAAPEVADAVAAWPAP
jgi:HEAT repeat protein